MYMSMYMMPPYKLNGKYKYELEHAVIVHRVKGENSSRICCIKGRSTKGCNETANL